MIITTGLDDFPTALSTPILLADGRTVIAAIHATTPGTSEIAYSAAYIVSTANVASKVLTSERLGKDIACSLDLVGTTLRLWVTEAVPGGSGSTANLHRYEMGIGIGAMSNSSGSVVALCRALISALQPFA